MLGKIPASTMAMLLLLAAACSGYNESPSPPTGASTPVTVQTASALASSPSECPAAAPAPASIPGVPAAPANAKPVTTPSGLQYIDLVPGSGPAARAGQTASVQYTGWLLDGKKFDSSRDRGQPFSFPIGGGQVIKGWDEGVASMQVGGQRRLIVPAGLGYGPKGAGGTIPPCATLVFDVELLGVK